MKTENTKELKLEEITKEQWEAMIDKLMAYMDEHENDPEYDEDGLPLDEGKYD